MTLPTHLLWLDLETTGLDTEEYIIEVAATLAPFTSPFATSGPWVDSVIRHRGWGTVAEDVIAMHAKNGLLGESWAAKKSIHEVEEEILKLIPVSSETKSIVLAGSSVHFDLGFVRKKMPKIAVFLHHRTYDVSVLRNFAYSLGMPEDPHEEGPHRARADLSRSIDMGARVVRWFKEKFGDERELELRRNKVVLYTGVEP